MSAHTQTGRNSAEAAGAAAKPPWEPSSKPHPARVYDYWYGGGVHYPADRAVAERFIEIYPEIKVGLRENIAFLRRAVTCLVREAGIRQFLDVSAGIAPAGNTHEVAQALAPESRVVYALDDPAVLARARATFESTPEGAVAFVEENITRPDSVIRQARELLDFTQPIGVISLMTLQFVVDDNEAYGIVGRFMNAVPPGSHLVVSIPTADLMEPGVHEQLMRAVRNLGIQVRFRSRREFGGFFRGLELLPPGIEYVPRWRDEDEPQPRPRPPKVGGHAAVGRKP